MFGKNAVELRANLYLYLRLKIGISSAAEEAKIIRRSVSASINEKKRKERFAICPFLSRGVRIEELTSPPKPVEPKSSRSPHQVMRRLARKSFFGREPLIGRTD